MNAVTKVDDIITNWRPEHAALFGQHTLRLNHSLIETGLFTREALARLIERCPPSELGLVARRTVDGVQKRSFGVLGKASGADAIAAIERGQIWMNIRRVMDWAPEYKTLLDRVFGEFESRMPGFTTNRRNLGVLISSPNAEVFYHTDIQGQSLWQIEGRKRLRIYPTSELFLPPHSVEKILLRETDEDMAFKPWFDEFAEVIDLNPGEMATWPLYAPHRVDNHDCLNVSVTMEHWTQEIWNAYAVNYGNGVLRRSVGFKGGSRSQNPLNVYPKAAAAFVWKKLGLQKAGDVDPTRQFQIDAAAPTGVSSLA